MGVDYRYSGSASYPRFYEEVEGIAVKVFGAKKTEDYGNKQADPKNNDMIGYFMGRAHTSCDKKFDFPDDVPETVQRFLEKPQDKYTDKEVRQIWEAFKCHPEIDDISNQIYEELKYCAKYGYDWYLC